MAKHKKSGLSIDSPGFFTELPIPKIHLADELGIARSTLWQWHKVAYYHVIGFRESYPLLPDGRVDKTAPLNPYQAWCISQIGRLFKIFGTENRVKQYIKTNPDDFSSYKFTVAAKAVWG